MSPGRQKFQENRSNFDANYSLDGEGNMHWAFTKKHEMLLKLNTASLGHARGWLVFQCLLHISHMRAIEHITGMGLGTEYDLVKALVLLPSDELVGCYICALEVI